MLAVRGCAPAWKPDGTLTYVDEGDLVAPRSPECHPARVGCLRPVLTRKVLNHELRAYAAKSQARPFTLMDIVWLTSTRLAAVVRRPLPSPGDFVVFFERGRLAAAQDGFFPHLSDLRALPLVYEVSVRARGVGFLRIDYGGRLIAGGGGGDARAISPSPDGRWRAEASGKDVCISSRRTGFDIPDVCLPFAAVDVAWAA